MATSTLLDSRIILDAKFLTKHSWYESELKHSLKDDLGPLGGCHDDALVLGNFLGAILTELST